MVKNNYLEEISEYNRNAKIKLLGLNTEIDNFFREYKEKYPFTEIEVCEKNEVIKILLDGEESKADFNELIPSFKEEFNLKQISEICSQKRSHQRTHYEYKLIFTYQNSEYYDEL